MKHYPLLLIGFLFFSSTTSALEKTEPKQNAEIQQHVQHQVPYKLDQTLQTFTKTVHGGVQHVVVKSADNNREIKLIQEHLHKLAQQFSKGDFSATERVHGKDMPGLAQLKRAEPDDIKFEYKALDNGAQIHYSTEYPQYVQALHEWFDAQIHDHGNDNIPGHVQHHSTPAD